MSMIKPTKLASVLLLLFAPIAVQAADIEKSLPAREGGEVRISITSGEIEILGWDEPNVKLSGDFSGKEDRLVFKKSGRHIKLEVKNEGGKWWWGNDSGHADFTLHVPISSSLDINGTSLNIEINRVAGRVEANTISGRVRLRGGQDRVDIETISGDIDIDDVAGKVNLSTVSGDINAISKAYTFDARSVSGDIEGEIGRSELVNLISVSGDIDVELELAEDGRVEGQTVSGNIELDFTNRQLDADFDIETGPGGDISNRLSKDRPDDGRHFGQSLSFSQGDGKGNVELETMSGTIKLR